MTQCSASVIRSPKVHSWRYPGLWTQVLPRLGIKDPQSIGEEQVSVAVPHRIEDLGKVPGIWLRLDGVDDVRPHVAPEENRAAMFSRLAASR